MTSKKKLPEAQKADLVLSNSKEIIFDFNAVSFKAMLGIFDKEELPETTNLTIAKVCGFMSLEEFYECSANDVRKCQRAVIRAWINWQDDPNG